MEDRKTLYLESSVISYYTSRQRKVSKDPIVRGRQEVTKKWWDNHRSEFRLFMSKAVVDEISEGDKDAVKDRLDLVTNIPLLDMKEEIFELALNFITNQSALPEKAYVDALHIAVATVHGIDYLLTWNCRHIANAIILPEVKQIAESQGYAFPQVCTPDQLLGE